MGPLLTRLEWNDALLKAGFEQPLVSLPDSVEENHVQSLFITRSTSAAQFTGPHKHASIAIVADTTRQQHVASLLQGDLNSESRNRCEIVPLAQVKDIQKEYDEVISLAEFGRPMLAHLTEETFAALQRIFDLSKHITWVTENCGKDAKSPEAAMMTGFSKCLMRERPQLSVVHLNLMSESDIPNNISRVVTQNCKTPRKYRETDMTEDKGIMLIPRAIEAPHINNLLDSEIHGPKFQSLEVGGGEETGDEALELNFSPGRLDSFHFVQSRGTSPPLEESEIRILVKATGINFRDVLVALNQVSADHIGQEFAGVVVETGSRAASTFCPGDRVCGCGPGSFRTYLTTKTSHVIKIPPGLSLVEASAIPMAYLTVQYGLSHLARLQPGESILIHAAAGAVGQAAIRLGQKIGAIIYVTVSSPEKKRLLMDSYGIESSHFFSSRHTRFAEQIMQVTEGKGVDVVLNSLAGRALSETWRCIAPFGRFIEIGKRDISAFKTLSMEPFARNVSFCSLDLSIVKKHRDVLFRRLVEEVQELVLDETFSENMTPKPLTVFKRSEFEKAFRYLQTGQHAGKAVVDWELRDTIRVSRDFEECQNDNHY